jgi:ubiquitin-activating enzyme E1 C
MSFFSEFQVIIAGLDNVEARRWLNSTVHRMVPFDENDEPEVGTVLIDGGTEGF